MSREDLIQQALEKHFSICYLVIEDLSSQHQDHPEAQKAGGGHYQIMIVSNEFEGKSAIQRHRLINHALKDLIGESIHALSLKLLTNNEFEMLED